MKHAKNPTVAVLVVAVDGDSLEDAEDGVAVAAGAISCPSFHDFGCTVRADAGFRKYRSET